MFGVNIRSPLAEGGTPRWGILSLRGRLFISLKLDHPFRSKLNHPELPVKEGVKIGLIFG